MRRALALFAMFAGITGTALAGEWTGYVTDLKCAKAGKAGEAHAGCAQGCVKGGEPIAFVNEADGKVYQIANQDALTEHVGHKVTLTGEADGDSIEVESVEM